MAGGPFVLRDLSACYYARGDGETSPVRLRAMRMLVAREDPERESRIRYLATCPQSFVGCLFAAQSGLWPTTAA